MVDLTPVDNVASLRTWILVMCEAKSDLLKHFVVDGCFERDAIHQFNAIKLKNHSVVLFRTDDTGDGDWIPLRIHSEHIVDTAAILLACCVHLHQQGRETDKSNLHQFPTTGTVRLDRDMVQQKLLNGEAPMIPPSRSKIQQWLMKCSMDLVFHRPTVAFFSARPNRMASLCYFNVNQYPGVRGHIALSLDDAPGRLGPRNSRLHGIRTLLSEYGHSKATFMVIGRFIPGYEADLIQLLQEGHELGNHGYMDRAYESLNESPADFLESIDHCSDQIRSLQCQTGITPIVRYFRAPHGIYTREMEKMIHSRNMINVMCDAYASDPVVEDGDYIAKSLLRQARDGGIILLHIPEVGFRDYCMVALRQLLKGLQQRKLKVVSIGMLEELAHKSTIR